MSNWRNTVFIVPKGPEDHYERFAAQYPTVERHIRRVCSDAGTSDADWSVLKAAGALVADYDDWCMRAVNAMRTRQAHKFDSLITESKMLRLVDPETGNAVKQTA